MDRNCSKQCHLESKRKMCAQLWKFCLQSPTLVFTLCTHTRHIFIGNFAGCNFTISNKTSKLIYAFSTSPDMSLPPEQLMDLINVMKITRMMCVHRATWHEQGQPIESREHAAAGMCTVLQLSILWSFSKSISSIKH